MPWASYFLKKYIKTGPCAWCSKSEDWHTKCFSLSRHLLQIHNQLKNPGRLSLWIPIDHDLKWLKHYPIRIKRPLVLNGQLSTIAHTGNCHGVSYMHLMKFHSGVECRSASLTLNFNLSKRTNKPIILATNWKTIECMSWYSKGTKLSQKISVPYMETFKIGFF